MYWVNMPGMDSGNNPVPGRLLTSCQFFEEKQACKPSSYASIETLPSDQVTHTGVKHVLLLNLNMMASGPGGDYYCDANFVNDNW